MPNILLIAAEYPPGYAVGYMRVTKFEKYLPQFGFQTSILTVRSYGVLPTDKEKKVYRAFDAGMIYRPLTRFLFRSKISEVSPSTIQTTPLWGTYEGTAFNHFRQWVLDTFAIPDLQIGWLPFALLAGLRAIQTERVDAIFSTSSPETSHLLAMCLAYLTRKPWVADFRDGWIFESLKPILRRSYWRRQLERWLERCVVSHADAIVSISSPITDYFTSTYPLAQDKSWTITNGYDPDDWINVKPQTRSIKNLRLVHTGALSLSASTRDAYPFFQALQQIDSVTRSKIEILLVGDLSSRERSALSALGLQDIVQVVGRVSKEESLSYQLSADVLLLIVGSDKSVATSKLYEYLYARRPILALSSHDTAAAQIIQQSQAGYLADPNDATAIANCLADLFKRWEEGNLVAETSAIEQYSRYHLTEQLAQVLRSVIDPK